MERPASDSTTTRRLLEQARQGDKQSLNQLFSRHRPDLLELVTLRLDRRLCSRVDPSDIVQETHLEAARRLDDYFRRQPMPFYLWLRKTAQQRVAMMHRQQLTAAGRDVRVEVPLPEGSSVQLAQQLLAHELKPDEAAARDELVRHVRCALGRMSDADREILLMRDFEGLSYQELAYVLGIEPEAAKKRHGRALVRLHKLLMEERSVRDCSHHAPRDEPGCFGKPEEGSSRGA
jgi:RNA polymerase sigma-70 factor (ECF subfamily)